MKIIQHIQRHWFLRLGPRAVGCLLMACALALTAQAQSVQKIALVDMNQIVSKSRSIQESVRKAEEQVRPETDRADAKMREMQNMRQSLADRRSVMKEEDIKQEESRINALYDDVEEMKVGINKKIKRVREEVMEPELHRVVDAVKRVAVGEGYDMVLSSETVLYHSETVDITALVIQTLDRESSSPAPKASDSSSSKPARRRTKKKSQD